MVSDDMELVFSDFTMTGEELKKALQTLQRVIAEDYPEELL
jgi:hypothetical protein